MTADASYIKTIAIIPARGGSKGVPRKNIKKVGGFPLVARAIRTCQASGAIDQVYVSTDSDEIAAVAREYGAEIIERPAEISGDTASSEAAILHSLDHLEAEGIKPAVVAFIQATSPFISAESLANAVNRVKSKNEDVVFAAFETYAFLWKKGPDGVSGTNHDHSFRPRRQDRDPNYQETGAFYVMDVPGFKGAKFRFFGTVGIEEVSERFSLEIDNPEELEAARAIAHQFESAQSAKLKVKALVMDFDGVHTDDTVIVDSNGKESVRVSRSDGMGISLLKSFDFKMLILSKETNTVVKARADKLGIEVMHGIDDKLSVLTKWCRANGLELADIAYIGNDINDVACLEAVGLPIVPADANPAARDSAKIVLNAKGGRGAIREVADLIAQTLEKPETQD